MSASVWQKRARVNEWKKERKRRHDTTNDPPLETYNDKMNWVIETKVEQTSEWSEKKRIETVDKKAIEVKGENRKQKIKCIITD